MTSTRYSRRIVVERRATTPLREIKTLEDGAYKLATPRVLEPGVYRAELDPQTRTAQIRKEES